MGQKRLPHLNTMGLSYRVRIGHSRPVILQGLLGRIGNALVARARLAFPGANRMSISVNQASTRATCYTAFTQRLHMLGDALERDVERMVISESTDFQIDGGALEIELIAVEVPGTGLGRKQRIPNATAPAEKERRQSQLAVLQDRICMGRAVALGYRFAQFDALKQARERGEPVNDGELQEAKRRFELCNKDHGAVQTREAQELLAEAGIPVDQPQFDLGDLIAIQQAKINEFQLICFGAYEHIKLPYHFYRGDSQAALKVYIFYDEVEQHYMTMKRSVQSFFGLPGGE
jgi:hypothetical protein